MPACIQTALSAFGTLLKIGNGQSPEEFATLAELRSVSGPSISADTLETTTHNTPTPWKRFITGLLDGGEISADINFNPSEPTHSATQGILAIMQARLCRNVQIVFPDDANTTWVAPCIVTAFEMSADPADILSASLTLKVAGPPTLT